MRFYFVVGSFLLTVQLFSASPFVQVEGGQFILNGQPYHFIGTNFWYGMNLGAPASGDQDRLIRELDRLYEMGVTNLRILAGSEGPMGNPWQVVPTLQPNPGTYDEDLWMGLDFLLYEIGKRNMKAVVCLTNFWPWSGGMA